ncbi:P-loop containing nucleoside triphosphate hydrolase protein [Aspergillus caelatus]|uniref:P-loop containing nucleoside triphosphate hydrolase protein n=1 Tax=Aspergillus caelatus TaxID=61420 RepID=A0A5N7A8B5_9EURO|nr:P-loop containing nucleoside triphosphate hydrolase protein [Aspergillus caelatus]KAE8365658.1 P-loop containing nucleoside triphosphate hydrolase protein [Aspergillus caelatus]
MSEPRLFTVRPLSKQARNDHKDAFRVYLSSSSLAALKLRAGDTCTLNYSGECAKTAIAWSATENIQTTVVQTSRTLQDCYGVKLGEKVSISKTDGPLGEIESISFVECSDIERMTRYGPLPPSERHHWAWALEFPLARCDALAVGLIFDLELKGQRRSFKVATMRALNQTTHSTLLRFTENSKILIGDDSDEEKGVQGFVIKVQSSGLGGMGRQIDSINESLADFNIGSGMVAMPAFYEHTRGVLLYGPKGTGKTALLRQIQGAGWRKAFNIGSSTFSRNIGDGEAKLRKLFQDAVRCQPSVVVIDQLDFIAPKRTSLDSQSLTSVLCECLDLARGAMVLVVAATRHPNEVDDTLRTPHRLATEIELHIPTAYDRAEILRAICGYQSPVLSDRLIDMMAEKTHGYVGADLFALLQLVCRKARQRQIKEAHSNSLPLRQASMFTSDSSDDLATKEIAPLEVQEADVLTALQETRPTAMREVFLETPKVRWSDIGGQHDIKRRLQKAVERPLKVSVYIDDLQQWN